MDVDNWTSEKLVSKKEILRYHRCSLPRLEAMNSGRGYRAKDHKKIEMITLGG